MRLIKTLLIAFILIVGLGAPELMFESVNIARIAYSFVFTFMLFALLSYAGCSFLTIGMAFFGSGLTFAAANIFLGWHETALLGNLLFLLSLFLIVSETPAPTQLSGFTTSARSLLALSVLFFDAGLILYIFYTITPAMWGVIYWCLAAGYFALMEILQNIKHRRAQNNIVI